MSLFSDGLVYQNTGNWNDRGDAIYTTIRPFEYYVGDKGSTLSIKIPEGFETDLASIPRFLRWWLSPDGPWVQSAVMHDWLYQGVYVDRWLCDYLMWEGMGVGITRPTGDRIRIHWFKRTAIYYGIRLGGWVPYNRYRQMKEEGTL